MLLTSCCCAANILLQDKFSIGIPFQRGEKVLGIPAELIATSI